MVFGAIARGIGSVLGGLTGGLADGIQGPRPTAPRGSISTRGQEIGDRSADYVRQRFLDELHNQNAFQVQAPTNINPSYIDTNAVNPYAQRALGMSEQAAVGNVPSAAAIQQQQGLEQALKYQQAAANSARGGAGNQIAAIRNAQNQGAQLQQQAIGNAAALRAQEMAQARALFGNQAFQQAGLQQQGLLANQGVNFQSQLANQNAGLQHQALGLQSQGQENARRLSLLGGLSDAERLRLAGTQADIASQTALEQARLSGQNQADQQYNRERSNIGGGIMNALGTGLGLFFSDEKTKTNIHDGGDEAQKFLDALDAHVYEYKKKHQGAAAPAGKHLSPMAQDLEKSEVGRQIVHETGDGTKMVDYSSPQGYGAILAALGHLNEKVKSMEGRRSKRG